MEKGGNHTGKKEVENENFLKSSKKPPTSS